MENNHDAIFPLHLICFKVSEEMSRLNRIGKLKEFLSPGVEREFTALCKEFDIEPEVGGTKTGSISPYGEGWQDYIVFEMVFCKFVPHLTQMISDISENLPIKFEGETSLPYRGYYFVTSKYCYARMLPGGELRKANSGIVAGKPFLMRGESMGHHRRKKDTHLVGFNYELKINFENVFHEIIHAKISGNDEYPHSEEWFDAAVEKVAQKMGMPLKKSIWNWSEELRTEHESLKKVFKGLADKIQPNLKRWKIDAKLPFF